MHRPTTERPTPAPHAPVQPCAPPDDAAEDAAVSARYAQRTADLAEAVAEHDALAARLRRDIALDRTVLPEDITALVTLRHRIRRLRPHTLLWRATLAGGATVAVETRDRIDFADDTSDVTVVVGAIAEVPWRDPAAMSLECREAEESHYDGGWRDREADHRAAALRLCDANGWEGATVERDGERWEP
jgi:hypothetical protein